MVTIGADVSWLACQEQCLPGKASAKLELPVTARATSANAELIEKWTRALPVAEAPPLVSPPTVQWTSDPGAEGKRGSSGALAVSLRWRTIPKSVYWFPESLSNARLKNLIAKTVQDVTTITFELSADKADDLPKQIDGVLSFQEPDGTRRGVLFPVRIMVPPGG